MKTQKCATFVEATLHTGKTRREHSLTKVVEATLTPKTSNEIELWASRNTRSVLNLNASSGLSKKKDVDYQIL